MQATADSFLRTGYFGGLRTVQWVDYQDDDFPGFNQSGANLLGNLRGMQTAKQKKTEMAKVSFFEEISDEPGNHCYKGTRR